MAARTREIEFAVTFVTSLLRKLYVKNLILEIVFLLSSVNRCFFFSVQPDEYTFVMFPRICIT